MSYKNILVQVDSSDACRKRLEAAAQIAVTHEAHLTGFHAIPEFKFPVYAEVKIPAEIFEKHAKGLLEEARTSQIIFEEVVKAAGALAEWRSEEGDVAKLLTMHGRYADLVVVGQRKPEDTIMTLIRDMPDQVILTTGRPVLVVPYNFQNKPIGKRVMIGWDASQAAARAVYDAMPFLKAADQVEVMVVNPKKGECGHSDLPGADLAAHLARHGVIAEANHVTNDDVDTGNQLLSRAADMSADLIVIGAYGHARWKEVFLGGVTSCLLDSMTMPVLMSH